MQGGELSECEICGAEAPLYTVEIDRARLRVCYDCSKSGKLIEAPRQQAKEKPRSFESEIRQQHRVELDLVTDYGRKIKSARERMHLTRNVLAEMINEKESFLLRVEEERTFPTESLAKKLEKALGIALYEEVGVSNQGVLRGEKKGLTLGDVIKVKKRGEKEDGD